MNTPASVRVWAAEWVMNPAAKGIEIGYVEAGVSELDRATEASRQKQLTVPVEMEL